MRRLLVSLLLGVLLAMGLAPAALGQEATEPPPPPVEEQPPPPPAEPGVPEDSGEGRRIVYSNGQQRVWLVEADGTVAKTHLVTGRRNFPRRGTFSVFSK